MSGSYVCLSEKLPSRAISSDNDSTLDCGHNPLAFENQSVRYMQVKALWIPIFDEVESILQRVVAAWCSAGL